MAQQPAAQQPMQQPVEQPTMAQPMAQPMQQQPVPQQPVPQQTEDPFEKLTKLKGLLDQGIITQEDFDKTKDNILGGLGG